MEISSNTRGKLLKIRNRQVFSNTLTFLKELLQNAQRARAKHVTINVGDGRFVIADDGCGCRPEAVFTLDFSEWDSTKEGFGIGFWSVLAIPDLKTVNVSSRRWSGRIDVDHLFDAGDLSVSMGEITYMKGFALLMESPWFSEHEMEIEAEIERIARYLPFETTVNGIDVERSTILDDFVPENGFAKTFSHRGYKAKLSPSGRRYCSYVKAYYDGREISELWWLRGECEGVIDITPGTVTMKEPDRTEVVMDDRYEVFKAMVEKDVKDTYKAFIQERGVDDEAYADRIADLLSVKDYDKYLEIDPSLLMSYPSANADDETPDAETIPAAERPKAYAASVSPAVSNPEIFREPDFKCEQRIRVIPKRRRKSYAEGGNFREGIRKLRIKSFYVKASEAEMYKDAIAEAKYAGLNVLIAKNALYERAFQDRKIPYISTLQDQMLKVVERKNSYLRNKKEQMFVSLFDPIVQHYSSKGLRPDTFRMADLQERTEVYNTDGKRIYRRIVKNVSGDVKIFGETDGENIFLDRTAMNLKAYDIRCSGGKLGIWEYRALLHALPTVAHELAHFLYHTTDNTVEHYQAIEQIECEIAELYR
jgi:hypothetical protein